MPASLLSPAAVLPHLLIRTPCGPRRRGETQHPLGKRVQRPERAASGRHYYGSSLRFHRFHAGLPLQGLRGSIAAGMCAPPASSGHDDHVDASAGRAHDLRGRAPVTALPRGLCFWEEWVRRTAHRAAVLAAVKRGANYLAATQDPTFPRPQTPDPTDRTVSKRRWERGVQQWRKDLEGVVANLPTASGAAIVIDDDGPDL